MKTLFYSHDVNGIVRSRSLQFLDDVSNHREVILVIGRELADSFAVACCFQLGVLLYNRAQTSILLRSGLAVFWIVAELPFTHLNPPGSFPRKIWNLVVQVQSQDKLTSLPSVQMSLMTFRKIVDSDGECL